MSRTFPVNISLPLLQWFSNWFSLISLVFHGSGGPQIKDTSFVHKPLQSRRGGGGGGGGDGGGDDDGDNGPLPSGPTFGWFSVSFNDFQGCPWIPILLGSLNI